MKKINRENYEVFAIDFIEGNLSVEMHQLFEIFLIENPDIAEELDLLPTLSTPEPSTINKDLSELKKGAMLSDPISIENCDLYFTAYNEGDLSASEQRQVNLFLEGNPDKIADFKQIGLLRFIADQSIVYPNKKALKKAIPLIPIFQLRRIAAIFIVLFGLGIILFALTKKEMLYSERENIPSFPIEKNVEDVKLPEQVDEPLKVAEQIAQIKSKPIQKVRDPKPVIEEPIAKEETLIAENKTENKELPNKNILTSNTDEIIEDPVLALQETPQDEQTSRVQEKQDNNETLIKFKRPSFKKQNDEDAILANNDSETLIKISNPFKSDHSKDLSIGPIKISRK